MKQLLQEVQLTTKKSLQQVTQMVMEELLKVNLKDGALLEMPKLMQNTVDIQNRLLKKKLPGMLHLILFLKKMDLQEKIIIELIKSLPQLLLMR